ncbi:SVAGG family GlyGly-CTERM protein [Shewanella sp. MBTL60-007]|uniref:SVAGG family GlyGly-CTERM protein n=1 Tax=Shewanella sp. MBTL60-007 TaxID=2815911 RepID=UPI001BC078F3|nr:SVAGG family GlyGly-CTERM protein [Shewanella sp. MBTL60-007]GIU20913.1 hypothetical protein TUM3792_21130 [Shewanella sp. MBTL60-007]
MKTLLTALALTATSLATPTFATEQIDLLVVVEPAVYESISREELGTQLLEQVARANQEFKEYDLHHNIVAVLDWRDNHVSEQLAQNHSFAQSLADIMYSIRYTEQEYNESFKGDPYAKPFVPTIGPLVDKYHADKLVFISQNSDSTNGAIGQAFQNFGMVIKGESLKRDPSIMAHELGHNIGMAHPSSAECDSNPVLMCINVSSARTGFNDNDKLWLDGVINNDPEYLVDHFDHRFYLGRYSSPMEMMVNSVLVMDSTSIDKDVNSVEVMIELHDSEGNLSALGHDVSLEFYTKQGSAQPVSHYDSDAYQRVTFLAGETQKSVDISVTHSDADKAFQVGTRYGLNVAESSPGTLTIKAGEQTPVVPPVTPDTGDSSGGGSLGFISLLLLLGFSLKRKV